MSLVDEEWPDPGSTDSVAFEFRVEVDVRRLYEAITRPESLAHWIRHPGLTTLSAHGELRVGGQWWIRFARENGEIVTAAGEYLTLDKEHYLELLLHWDDTVSDTPPFHPMRLRIQLDGVGEATYVRLAHEGLVSRAAWEDHVTAWRLSGEALIAYLA